jgi:hypothetical protein
MYMSTQIPTLSIGVFGMKTTSYGCEDRFSVPQNFGRASIFQACCWRLLPAYGRVLRDVRRDLVETACLADRLDGEPAVRLDVSWPGSSALPSQSPVPSTLTSCGSSCLQ